MEIQIMQTVHSRNVVVLPVLICTVLSLLVFWWRKMNLDRKSSLLLIGIYAAYIAFSVATFAGDKD